MTTKWQRFKAGTRAVTSVFTCCCPCTGCQTRQYIRVNVKDARDNTTRLANVNVVIVDGPRANPPINAQTDGQGDTLRFVDPGPYDVFVWLDGYLPQPAQQLAVNVPAAGWAVVHLLIEPLSYELRVDADRDGAIDLQCEALNAVVPWAWVDGNRGAIVPVNNDDDDFGNAAPTTGNPDCDDGTINGANAGDDAEVALLQVFRDGRNTVRPPPSWTASFTVGAGEHHSIRIFDSDQAGAATLIDSANAAHAPIALHGAAAPGLPTTLHAMEAVRYAGNYPGGAFNGIVTVTLTIDRAVVVSNPHGAPVADYTIPARSYFSTAQLKVAPWLMPHHAHDAHTVYVVDCGPDVLDPGGNYVADGNAAFRGALAAAVGAAGANLQPYARPGALHAGGDRWMQDCIEIGYSTWPGGANVRRVDAAMQTYRNFGADDLKFFAASLLRDGVGFHFPGQDNYQAALTAATNPPNQLRTVAEQTADDTAFDILFQDAVRQSVTNRVVPPPAAAIIDAIADEVSYTAMHIGVGAGQLANAATTAHGGLTPLQATNIGNDAAGAVGATNAAVGVISAAVGPAVENAFQGIGVALSATVVGRDADYATIAAAATAAANVGAGAAMTLAERDRIGRMATKDAGSAIVLGSDFDSGGNIEVTPPVQSTAAAINGAKDYAWGRIYIGDTGNFDADYLAFLRAQEIQDPIVLDSEWLHVGHVDEFLSFVPDPARGQFKQWRLLVASPTRAYNILHNVANPADVMFQHRYLDDALIQTTVNTFLTGNPPIPDPATGMAISGPDLEQWNIVNVQAKIDAALQVFVDEINLTVPADVIEIPTVFRPRDPGWQAPNLGMGLPGVVPNRSVEALTAGMVNMLVINSHCVIPIPYGPQPVGVDHFRQYVTNALGAVGGLTLHWVSDWDEYHAQAGEIHCGTNTLRRPAAPGAWLGSPDARWWNFPG